MSSHPSSSKTVTRRARHAEQHRYDGGSLLGLASGLSVYAMLLVALPADAAGLETIGSPQVRFSANGPAGLAISGKSENLSGRQQGSNLVFTASLTQLKTGIDMRDKHLRDYLETEKFPTAKLSVNVDQLKKPDDKAKVSGKHSAELTLHGVTKPVQVKYDAKRTGSDMHVEGETQIDIRDFNVKVPCYLGVCVRPEVQIAVKFKLREK